MENSTEKQSLLGKINSLVNKLPFNKFLGKIPLLKKVSKYANWAFCVAVLFILLACLFGGASENVTENPLVGTWRHYYNGSDSEAFYDDDGIASDYYTFYSDGSYEHFDVSRTSTRNSDKKFLNNGGVASLVLDYKTTGGTYEFDGKTLVLEPDYGKTKEYEIETIKEGRKIALGKAKWIYTIYMEH